MEAKKLKKVCLKGIKARLNSSHSRQKSFFGEKKRKK
jgi:hypothetical protein